MNVIHAALEEENVSADGCYSVEFRLRVSDGSFRWMAARGHVTRDLDGKPVRLSGVRWDIEERKKAETERAAFAQQQTRIAETLQRSLLITPEPAQFPGMEVFTVYEPASAEALVGGDFFDAFPLREGKVALVVGDITGKGLTAAADTAEIKFSLRAYLREQPSPANALDRMNRHVLNRHLLDDKPADIFACLSVVVLDPATGAALFAVAGMEPPLIKRAATGAVEVVPVIGSLLGALPTWDSNEAEDTLLPGDIILLCSDGITEARRGRTDDFFDLNGVSEALASVKQIEKRSLEQIAHTVLEAARNFTPENKLKDDACLLLARRR